VTPPPPLLLVAYRLFAWRLGPPYRAWTYDDITRRGYTLRQAVPVAVVVGALLAAVFALAGDDPRRAIPPVVGVILLAFLLRNNLRDRAVRQQGLSPTGEPVAAWFDDDAVRRRRNINSSVLTAVLILGAMVLLVSRSR
jgi:predicted PurR-regulated permease PerM